MARSKGTLNKFTRDMKDALELAFNRSGGVDYLVRIAKDEPKLFCALLGKLIPAQITVSVTNHIDLATAMIAAEETIKRLSAPNIIDVTPEILEESPAPTTVVEAP